VRRRKALAAAIRPAADVMPPKIMRGPRRSGYVLVAWCVRL
jgi:hypothetical protein